VQADAEPRPNVSASGGANAGASGTISR
jgi:hypothetical protein